MKFKKAQGNVSGLVILIGFLIVIYVLLMPPCDKCELLGGCSEAECTGTTDLEDGVLLSVFPGEVSDGSSNKLTYNFNSMNLFINIEPEVSLLVKDVEVSKSWFGSLDQDFTFKINDLEDLDFAYISFLVMDVSGNLYVYLNDKQVFFGELVEGQLKEIALPVDYLEENNVLSLYTDPPGILFWVKHKYLLRDLELTKEFIKFNSVEES